VRSHSESARHIFGCALGDPSTIGASHLRAALALWRYCEVFVAVPAVVMILCYFLPMPPAVEIALIALSVSPMLPTLPNDLAKVGADNRYAIGLQVVSAFMTLIAAPIAFWIVGRIAQGGNNATSFPLSGLAPCRQQVPGLTARTNALTNLSPTSRVAVWVSKSVAKDPQSFAS
jgi:hypothetical protein